MNRFRKTLGDTFNKMLASYIHDIPDFAHKNWNKKP